MHRRHGALSTLAVALTVAGCSSTVQVSAPAGASAPACTAAATHFPGTVGGRGRVSTSSTSRAVAAWGDPAIIARCGVPPLGPTSDPCIEVNGVGWVAHRLSDGVRFTSFGTAPALEVLVPSAYRPEPLQLPAFTAAAQALPADGHRCR